MCSSHKKEQSQFHKLTTYPNFSRINKVIKTNKKTNKQKQQTNKQQQQKNNKTKNNNKQNKPISLKANKNSHYFYFE